MRYRPLKVFLSVVLSLALTVPVKGQTGDSLLNILKAGKPVSDREKYDLLCRIISNTGDDAKKIMYSDQAIELAGGLKIKPAKPYVLKGTVYLNSGDLPAALDCFIRAADFYREMGSNRGLASAYLYIAEVYTEQEDNSNVKYYLKNAINIYEKIRDSVNLASALHNLGYAYYKMGQYDSALIMYSRTKDLFLRQGDKKSYAYCLGNSGLVYSRLSEYDKAEIFIVRAIAILTQMHDTRAVIEYTIEYSAILQNKGEAGKAIGCARRAYNEAVGNHLKEYERDAAGTLSRLYRGCNRFDSAFHFQSLYITANDSLKNVENVQKMANLRTKFEVAKKQSEVEILEKNKLFQRIVILCLGMILILAAGLILLYRYSLLRSRKLTAALDERRILLEKQSGELKMKNESIIRVNEELERLYRITSSQKEEIISSINYAERIQHALLQSEDTVSDAFILFLPKDIVSGDFYWFYESGDYLFIAAVDCTGHGVPGAFMSIIGQNALNKVVKEKSVIRTAEILDQINIEVMETLLHRGEKAINDGMDISIVAIDRKRSVLEFSGAFSPMYIVRNGDLTVYKGNKFPIGKITYDAKLQFTGTLVDIQQGDMIYLFSDGYADQVGQGTGRKLMSKNVRNILASICDLQPGEQKKRLEKEFSDWKGNLEQVDDVLFIGIRIN